ncbi:MAG TPA: ABC transporter permease [Terriglobales bacterium]|nr:ABC transporter permease [Terriglobales bacterium]
MPALNQDLRYALRQLAKSPGFAVAAVLTLALGIGANTAVFSVMNAVLLRGLPVPNPQQLFYVHVPNGQPPGAGNTGNSDTSFSEPVFEQLRQDHHAFADLIAFVPLATSGKTAVRFGKTPEEAEGDMVSGNFFSGLGVPMLRGHGFSQNDEKNHAPVVVLSYSYWTRRFARNPSVLGQTLFVKGIPFTVIGISSPQFYGVEPGQSTDFWIPLQNRPELNAWGTPAQSNTLYGTPTWWCLELIARLAPGTSPQAALAEVNPLFQRAAYLGLGTPDPKLPRRTLALQPARGIEGLDEGSTVRTGTFVLMGLVGLVLVIDCVNVAMLLVARNSARQREFSLRLALGASRGQMFRQLLLESALLVVWGAALGWLFALGATRVLAAWSRLEISLSPDLTVLLFTVSVSVAAALAFGLAPLRLAAGAPLTIALKTAAAVVHQTRSARWGRNLAMAAQTAFCFVLLAAAGLLLRTLRNYENTSLGFRAQGLLVFGLTPQKTTRTAQNVQFYQALLGRVRTLPGIESATVMENRLGSGWSDNNHAVVDGVVHSFEETPVRSNTVGPDYFHVLGVPVLRGRDISDSDTLSSEKVAVVNQTFVQRLLPHTDPLGHQLGEDKRRYTIVGVVKDSKYTSVDETPIPMAYYAYTQEEGVGHMEVEVRTLGKPTSVLPSIQRVVHDMDANLPLGNPMTQQDVFEQSYSQQQMFSRLSSFFGLLAAFLVAIGMYGTLAYRVNRRTAEIGVRMALGATRPGVLWMVLRESLGVAGVGLAAGLVIALLAAGLMQSLLFGLQARDPMTFAIAFSVVGLVTLAASFAPARRASTVEPMQALRTE